VIFLQSVGIEYRSLKNNNNNKRRHITPLLYRGVVTTMCPKNVYLVFKNNNSVKKVTDFNDFNDFWISQGKVATSDRWGGHLFIFE